MTQAERTGPIIESENEPPRFYSPDLNQLRASSSMLQLQSSNDLQDDSMISLSTNNSSELFSFNMNNNNNNNHTNQRRDPNPHKHVLHKTKHTTNIHRRHGSCNAPYLDASVLPSSRLDHTRSTSVDISNSVNSIIGDDKPALPSRASKPPLRPKPKVRIPLTQREACAQEFVINEDHYLQSLQRLIYTYSQDLLMEKLLTPKEGNIVFPPSLEKIFQFHRVLKSRLQKQDWTCFELLVQEEFLSCYLEYVIAYDAAIRLLNTKYQKEKKFQDYLDRKSKVLCVETGEGQIKTLLIAPIQRMLRYKLTLQQFLKLTPLDHPDYKVIAKSLEYATVFAAKGEEQKTFADSRDKIEEISKTMWHCPPTGLRDSTFDLSLLVMDFHQLVVIPKQTIPIPVICDYCSRIVWRQGYQCAVCNRRFHVGCKEVVYQMKTCTKSKSLATENRLFLKEFSGYHTVIHMAAQKSFLEQLQKPSSTQTSPSKHKKRSSLVPSLELLTLKKKLSNEEESEDSVVNRQESSGSERSVSPHSDRSGNNDDRLSRSNTTAQRSPRSGKEEGSFLNSIEKIFAPTPKNARVQSLRYPQLVFRPLREAKFYLFNDSVGISIHTGAEEEQWQFLYLIQWVHNATLEPIKLLVDFCEPALDNDHQIALVSKENEEIHVFCFDKPEGMSYWASELTKSIKDFNNSKLKKN